MIIILEGSNGVGKSTYAKELASVLGIPIFRPFRHGNTDLHRKNVNEEAPEERLAKFGVEVNTHIEDFFAADFLAATGAKVVLDRSLPSALAYGQLGSGRWDTLYKSKNVCQEMAEVWQEIIRAGGVNVLYVWLVCDHAVAKGRGDGWKPTKVQREKLDRMFQEVFRHLKLPKMMINTGTIGVKEGVNRIVDVCLRNQKLVSSEE